MKPLGDPSTPVPTQNNCPNCGSMPVLPCSGKAATLRGEPCQAAIGPGEGEGVLLYGATHATLHLTAGQTLAVIMETHRGVAVGLTDPPINPHSRGGQGLAILCDDLLKQGQGQHEPLAAALLLCVELAVGIGDAVIHAMQGAVSHLLQACMDACLCSAHVGDRQQCMVGRVSIVGGAVVAQHLERLCLATRCQTDLNSDPLAAVCCDGVGGRDHEIDHAMPLGLLAHLLALLGLGGEGVVGGELFRGHVVPVVESIIEATPPQSRSLMCQVVDWTSGAGNGKGRPSANA